ncbi:hypothetical protein FACS1894176_03870 [Bacteroidia bacterium]|nr:hypothetical protein FACS1894176_03870 [Bacteroidia bacterium]
MRIDSLQIFGEEFYYGETVNVGMSVQTSDPDNTSYFWECSEGEFLQRQGYTLNQWKAPKKAGVYKIKCTVTCGGKKETREADILVSGLFFERFSSGEGTNALPTGWAQTNSPNGATQIRNHRMEVYVNENAQSHGELRYNIGQSNFFPPYSTKADVGIVGTEANNYVPKYPTSDATDDASFPKRFPSKDSYSAIAITGNTPTLVLAPTYFINELRVEFYPEADHVQPTYTYLPVGGTPGNAADSVTINKGDFDGVLTFQWTRRANVSQGITQLQSWYSIPFKAVQFIIRPEQSLTFGLSVEEDYTVSVAANGVEIFKSDALKTWRESIAAVDGVGAPLAAKEFKYIYPYRTRAFLDNVFFYTTAYYDGN